MPFTEHDLEVLRKVVRQETDASIKLALKPLERRVEALEGDKRRHSGGIRELDMSVKRATHEVEEASEKSLLAATNHLATVIETVRVDVVEIKDHQRRSIEPTAIAAAKAATSAEGASKANAVDLATIDGKQDKQLKWWRHPAVGALFLALIEAIKWAYGAGH